MIITAVFDAVACFDIEVPDGTPEHECEILAREWLDEHFYDVASEINDSDIDVREVYV